MGRFLAILIFVCALIGGGVLYYLQVYAYYEPMDESDLEGVRLTSARTGLPEEITWDKLQAIHGEDNPLRYRACFETTLPLAQMSGTYIPATDAVPLQGPGWFECFDAKAIGADLDAGRATAFLGEGNITYGIDRIVSVDADGQGYVWHQINKCGEAFYSGDPLPEGCPAVPDAANPITQDGTNG